MAIYPKTSEEIPFAYTALAIATLIVTGGVWQAFGWWLPFITCFPFVAFIVWEFYLSNLLVDQSPELPFESEIERAEWNFINSKGHADLDKLRKQNLRQAEELAKMRNEFTAWKKERKLEEKQ